MNSEQVVKDKPYSAQYGTMYDGWRTDPFKFGRDVFGIEYWTPDQQTFITACVRERRVACTAGQSVGKTFSVAFLTLYFLILYEDSIVITTSSSWENVENTLWREIRNLYRNARIPLGGSLPEKAPQLDYREKWFAIGLSTNDPTRFQGKHSKHVFIFIDEAVGVEQGIFDAAEAMAVGPLDKVICTANPTDATCAYYEECQKPDKWFPVVIDCENHPNVVYGRTIVPGAVSREWVMGKKREWGEDSPIYESRVKGRWSKKLGRLFPDWSEARHTYHASEVDLPKYLPRWIAVDWGFAHNSAALFFAYDGEKLYVEDEIVQNELTADVLARLIAERSRFYGNYFSIALAHDCFSRVESSITRAEMFNDATALFGMPAATPASRDRISGWNLITALLRTDKLMVAKHCEHLITKFPKAMRDPKKAEDMLKVEGDDEMDALYKGVLARPMEPQLPKEIRIARSITSTDPHTRAMQARIAASREDTVEDLGFLPRRSGRRFLNA